MNFSISDRDHLKDSIQANESDQSDVAHDPFARIAIDEKGNILFANNEFCALNNIPHEDLSDMRFEDLFKGPQNGKLKLTFIENGWNSFKILDQKKKQTLHSQWIEQGDKSVLILSNAPKPKSKNAHSKSVEQDNKAFVENLIRPESASENSTHAKKNTSDSDSFIELSDDIMIVCDLKGTILSANKNFQKLFATKSKSTKNFIDLFDSQDRAYVRNFLHSLSFENDSRSGAGPQNIIDFEARMPAPKDKNIGEDCLYFEWRQQRKGDQIFCLGRDVTRQHDQQDALSRRERQLLQAENIGRMGHWSWTIGQDSFEWSDEIYRIFGVNEDEFNPRIENLDGLIHRRDAGKVNQAFQRAIIQENDYDMEFRINRPDGEVRFIRCEGRCKKDESGEVTGLYGIMQDMTERMLYERELKSAKDAAERAYSAKTQFLANMSHELRTPLNAIIGFSEMMQRQLLGPLGTDKYMDYITGIRESGEHLLDLISDILDMSKIEAGKYELDLEEININKTMRLAVHMMAGRAEEAGVEIATNKLKRKKIQIVADRRAFMQIILNIVSNAVKFTKEGGKVWLECDERDHFVSIKICDTGIGIPPNKLHSITRPFEQVSTSYAREHDGSGLGLAITKELVELHGGSLFIDSTLEVGTTVTVRLPYKAQVRT